MRAMTQVARLGAVGLLMASVAGCATPPPADDPDAVAEFNQTNDPLEPTNRVLYKVNQGIDIVLLRPLAVGYKWAVPPYVRARVHNVLGNLSSPVVLANDMIQAKPRRAGDTLARFVINTTVGLGGIFDVATDLGYPYHNANFGQTLALYGVPAGPYLFLPLLGPGSPRDSGGYVADYFLDPVTWVGFYYKGAAFTDFTYARFGATIIDVRSELLDTLDKATEQALDPYATVRSLYRQNRDAGIEAARNDNRATTPAWYPAPGSH